MTAAASTSSGLDDLRARIAALQTRFVELGTHAASAAEDVRSGGMPPSEELTRPSVVGKSTWSGCWLKRRTA